MNEHNVIKEILDGAKSDFYALKHMGIDITQEKIERYANMRCDFEDCRYNNNGACQNEEKRKECVEVSKLVLCLEGKEDERE